MIISVTNFASVASTREALCDAPQPLLGYGTMQKRAKNVKISVIRLKWSMHVEKAFID